MSAEQAFLEQPALIKKEADNVTEPSGDELVAEIDKRLHEQRVEEIVSIANHPPMGLTDLPDWMRPDSGGVTHFLQLLDLLDSKTRTEDQEKFFKAMKREFFSLPMEQFSGSEKELGRILRGLNAEEKKEFMAPLTDDEKKKFVKLLIDVA